MTIAHIKALLDDSPAWIINEVTLQEAFHTVQRLQASSGCKILYSIKSMPFSSVLLSAKPYVTGFSVSSLFEARLARECASPSQEIHLTTPGIKAHELAELAELCTHINFNSLTHHALYAKQLENKVSIGVRVNPKLSFLQDERYNPCRSFSKLGVDIEQLWQSSAIEQVSGLHFHTVFAAENYSPLLTTIDKLTHTFHDHLTRLTWLNLGGGYLLNKISQHTPFIDRMHGLQKNYALSVYSEPGNALVKQSGTLIATVIDLFNSDGKIIVVLDTSINHLPEVFEYQQSPQLFEHDPTGNYRALVVGCTCLAGDIFGEYRFTTPLCIGDKLSFINVGAYSLVKANRFNGYNFPSIFRYNGQHLERLKQYSYQDYRQQWFADS